LLLCVLVMRTVVPQPTRQSTTRMPRRFWISPGVRLMIVMCFRSVLIVLVGVEGLHS
jgi:hypothetical protein